MISARSILIGAASVGIVLVGGIAHAGGTTTAATTLAATSTHSGAHSSGGNSTAGGGPSCHGIAASLTGSQCQAFRADKAALRAERETILGQYGITWTGSFHDAKSQIVTDIRALPKTERQALRAQMIHWRQERLTMLSSFGLTGAQGSSASTQ